MKIIIKTISVVLCTIATFLSLPGNASLITEKWHIRVSDINGTYLNTYANDMLFITVNYDNSSTHMYQYFDDADDLEFCISNQIPICKKSYSVNWFKFMSDANLSDVSYLFDDVAAMRDGYASYDRLPVHHAWRYNNQQNAMYVHTISDEIELSLEVENGNLASGMVTRYWQDKLNNQLTSHVYFSILSVKSKVTNPKFSIQSTHKLLTDMPYVTTFIKQQAVPEPATIYLFVLALLYFSARQLSAYQTKQRLD
jgi:hypothetical protein